MNKQTRQVSKESVLPVVREVRESCGCGLVSWSAYNSIPSVIEDDLLKVTMDTEDADPDREEKLKAAKEKVG